MKKIQNLLIACSLLLAGCSETPEETDGLPGPAPVKYVSLRLDAGAGTRAGLDDALRVKFQPGDMIDINGTAYEVFLLDDGTAAVPSSELMIMADFTPLRAKRSGSVSCTSRTPLSESWMRL